MDRQKKYSIKEVSELLNIPKATIRYWDSQGLIYPERNGENDYREFPLQVVMELSNISFYRNIEIPVKELKRMLESDLQVQNEILEEAEIRLVLRIQELQQQQQRIRWQMHMLEEVGRLQQNAMRQAVPVFHQVTAFERNREEHWKRIIDEPDRFVLVFEKGDTINYQYGIGYGPGEQAGEGEQEIWQRGESLYLEGLLVTDTYSESKNNLRRRIHEAAQRKIAAGTVMAQYLTSGVKGQDEVQDYYRMWMEIPQ